MPLQASGQISFSNIATELALASSNLSLRSMSSTAGKTVPDSISEFYGYSIVITVGYNVVAGGGAGGGGKYSYGGGGGGAGGFIENLSLSLSRGTTYNISVGGAGGNSSFHNITSTAGGAGGVGYFTAPTSGGSGGGGTYKVITGPFEPYGQELPGASGIAGQGNNGGNRGGNLGGAGGGADGVGGTSLYYGIAGNGGAAKISSITSEYYSGGGGGGGFDFGFGYYPSGNNGGGTYGLGGTGQFPSNDTSISAGQNGNQGIVIIRTLSSEPTATTTGSPTISISGSYRIYRFTGSGTIRFN